MKPTKIGNRLDAYRVTGIPVVLWRQLVEAAAVPDGWVYDC